MTNDKAMIIHQLSRLPGDQIVRYQERSIVSYNEADKSIIVTQVLGSPSHCRNKGECPLCGQAVDLDTMSYEARAYFALLQQALKRWRDKKPHQQSRNRTNVHRLRPEPIPLGNPFFDVESTVFASPRCDGEDSVILEGIPKHLLVDRYYETFFHEARKLGAGAYGEVYLCQHKLDELVLGSYAIKKIAVGDSIKWLHKVIREVKMRESLNHHNIVSYKHSWLELVKSSAINAPRVPWLFVLMEYCDGGDLEQFIANAHSPSIDPPVSDSVVWTVFLDLLTGLQYLHHSGIIHRDLKPSNIMLKIGQETLPLLGECATAHALLADFGTAEYVKGSCRSGLGFTGTVEYTAPELLEQDASGAYTADYDYKSDMWSLGWVLYALAYGSLPFAEGPEGPEGVRDSLLRFREQISTNPITPEGLPILPGARQIARPLLMRQVIAALLDPVPAKRPSCDFLLNHECLREVRATLGDGARVELAALCSS